MSSGAGWFTRFEKGLAVGWLGRYIVGMAIVAEITNALLGMAGLEEVSHGPPGLEERIIQDINRGLEHVGESNPNIFYQQQSSYHFS